MKSRIWKRVRNVLISIVVLLVVVVGGGVAYTWYVGQDEVKVAPLPTQTASPNLGVHKPPTISPNAPESASIQMLTSPVMPGDNASVTVKTNPDSRCTIKVVYDDKPSSDSGLVAKTADEYGMVTWTWTVETTVPFGKWPVNVTCMNAKKKSAVVQGDLVVAAKK